MQNSTFLACICRNLQVIPLSPNLLFIMKVNLFTFCIILGTASLLFATNGRGQDMETTRVNISADHGSLRDSLRQIERQSDFRFTYKDEEIEEYSNLKIKRGHITVKACLELLLRNTAREYKQIGNYIVLTERPQDPFLMKDVAQGFTVKGNVTDVSGQILPGVNVVIKGTTMGSVTDASGNYSITAPDDEGVLVFSFIGFARKEVPIQGRSIIDVRLAEDLRSLEEVVVVGYGTQKKSDLTGSISSVSQDELTAFPATNALQALQGRAAGVTIQATNGDPGGDFRIRVRGASSINASSDPLFVVDGLVGGILPPAEDIASIEVLKDASATAIYGSRGANGVVMITTKSGRSGETVVSLNSSYSSQKEIGRLELLNARQFAEYINEARNSSFYDLNAIEVDTDWQDLIFRPGYVQNHQMSVAGGNDKVQYYVSGVFYDHKGVIKTSAFDRYSLTTNLKFAVSDRARITVNSTLQTSTRDGVLTQSSGGVQNAGAVTAAHRFDPNQGVLDEDGVHTLSRVGIAAFENPVAVINGREEENRRENIQINLKGEFDIARGLVFNSTFGAILRNQRNGVYHSRISNRGSTTNGTAILDFGRNYNFLTEQYLSYDFEAGERNKFVVIGGYSHQSFRNESISASNAGFISDALGFWNLSAGTTLQAPSSGTTASEITSFYGRVNYNYDDRYLFTATARYDGASQFSEGNKWSFFPSGAFSWNVSNENFFPESDFVSNLKLRASYGLTGNQAIGPYASLARISPSFFVMNDAIVNAVRPTAIANKDLTWETTAQLSVGLDFEFFEGRVNLTGDYYEKKTSDLLFRVPIPAFSGYQDRLENLGEIMNSGFEFDISSKNLVGAFRWNTSINLTLNRNKVLSLPGGVDIIHASAPSFTGAVQNSILREGEPVGSFYGYVYEGVYQEGDQFVPGGAFETVPGGEKFADLNNDGVLDSQDRKIIGNPNPDAVWGLNNDFSYKGFTVNIFFQAFTGGDLLNLVSMELDRLSGNSNATVAALRRWTPENTATDVPKAASGRVPRTSTRFVEDGSFVRLKNVSIGYDFSSNLLSSLRVRTARIYLSGQNLLTFTKYSGVDPEVAYRSEGVTNSNINLGLDYGSYPYTTAYTIGINLGL
jgi:TonB-linked SusC/RagA family outer membrane protein